MSSLNITCCPPGRSLPLPREPTKSHVAPRPKACCLTADSCVFCLDDYGFWFASTVASAATTRRKFSNIKFDGVILVLMIVIGSCSPCRRKVSTALGSSPPASSGSFSTPACTPARGPPGLPSLPPRPGGGCVCLSWPPVLPSLPGSPHLPKCDGVRRWGLWQLIRIRLPWRWSPHEWD